MSAKDDLPEEETPAPCDESDEATGELSGMMNFPPELVRALERIQSLAKNSNQQGEVARSLMRLLSALEEGDTDLIRTFAVELEDELTTYFSITEEDDDRTEASHSIVADELATVVRLENAEA